MPQLTRSRLNTVVRQQAPPAAASQSAPGIDLDRFAVRRHPAGDRYIVTARSASAASPAPSGPAATTPRSVASTPGRRPAAVYSQRKRAELDEQYLQYYSTWRHIATSKTEKEADDLILSAIQRSPMRRFLEEGEKEGKRGEHLAEALERLHRQPQTVPKPVTLQDKRRKQLERMKQTWKLVDETASRNNSMSLESFLTDEPSSPAPRRSSSHGAKGSGWTQTPCTSMRPEDAGRGVACHHAGTGSQGQAHQRHAVPGSWECGTRSPAPAGWESISPKGKHRRDTAGTPGRLAEEARTALASLGIQRPPSTARCVSGNTAPSTSSTSPPSRGAGKPPSQDSVAPNGDQRCLERLTVHVEDDGSTADACELACGENTFSNRQAASKAPRPSPVLVRTDVGGGYETPVKGSSGEPVGQIACKSSPAHSEDGAWDAELDDLLKWTDNLSPVAEQG